MSDHYGEYSNPPQVGTDRSSGEAYSALRHQALSTQRTEVGIPAPSSEAPAWGILMETGYPETTATLFALTAVLIKVDPAANSQHVQTILPHLQV